MVNRVEEINGRKKSDKTGMKLKRETTNVIPVSGAVRLGHNHIPKTELIIPVS